MQIFEYRIKNTRCKCQEVCKIQKLIEETYVRWPERVSYGSYTIHFLIIPGCYAVLFTHGHEKRMLFPQQYDLMATTYHELICHGLNMLRWTKLVVNHSMCNKKVIWLCLNRSCDHKNGRKREVCLDGRRGPNILNIIFEKEVVKYLPEL